jgi:hypothetical protein
MISSVLNAKDIICFIIVGGDKYTHIHTPLAFIQTTLQFTEVG